MEHNQNLTDEFVAEAREHLQSVEQDLLTLEQQGKAVDSEVVARIFRSVHSLKGAAGFLGFTKINELSHIMETLLDMIRSKEMEPDSACVDGLFGGIDLLRAMIDDTDGSNQVDISRVYDQLAGIIGASTSSQVKEKMAAKVGITDEDGSSLSLAISEFQLDKIPRGSNDLFVLKFDLAELGSKGGLSPVALVRELLSTGEIIDARLVTTADTLEEDLRQVPLYYNVLYSTIMDRNLVEMATGLPEDRVIKVDPRMAQTNGVPEESVKPEPLPQVATVESVESEKPQKKEARQETAHKASDTIRINVDILDRLMALAGELVLVRNQHLMAVNIDDPTARGISQRLDIVTSELQESIMRTRMQHLGNVFGKLTRIVRDLSHKLDKKIAISITGNEVELDKTILEALADPLIHLIRNCCDHGLEKAEVRKQAGKDEEGVIKISAYHEAGHINICIDDDGQGIDPEKIKQKVISSGMKSSEELASASDKEIISLILLPGFTTAKALSDVSGRGVGMDVVRTSIEQFGGSLDVKSTKGQGTSVNLRLPLTLAIIPSLVVMVGDYRYAIPQVNLEELVCLYDDEVRTGIECAGDQEVFRLRDTLLPMVRLSEILARPEPYTSSTKSWITDHYHQMISAEGAEIPESLTFAVVKIGLERFGIIIDKVIGTEEIVVKPMHQALKNLGIYSGATVMGDGQVALILDIEGLARHADVEPVSQDSDGQRDQDQDQEMQNVLLFRGGTQEQLAVALSLIKRIEHIQGEAIEMVGRKEFITVDGISTRILRLDSHLDVSAVPEQEEYFLLLPKNLPGAYGVLISSLIDVVETAVDLNRESYMDKGIMGTAIVRDQMTLFLDIMELIELAEANGNSVVGLAASENRGGSSKTYAKEVEQ